MGLIIHFTTPNDLTMSTNILLLEYTEKRNALLSTAGENETRHCRIGFRNSISCDWETPYEYTMTHEEGQGYITVEKKTHDGFWLLQTGKYYIVEEEEAESSQAVRLCRIGEGRDPCPVVADKAQHERLIEFLVTLQKYSQQRDGRRSQREVSCFLG